MTEAKGDSPSSSVVCKVPVLDKAVRDTGYAGALFNPLFAETESLFAETDALCSSMGLNPSKVREKAIPAMFGAEFYQSLIVIGSFDSFKSAVLPEIRSFSVSGKRKGDLMLRWGMVKSSLDEYERALIQARLSLSRMAVGLSRNFSLISKLGRGQASLVRGLRVIDHLDNMQAKLNEISRKLAGDGYSKLLSDRGAIRSSVNSILARIKSMPDDGSPVNDVSGADLHDLFPRGKNRPSGNSQGRDRSDSEEEAKPEETEGGGGKEERPEEAKDSGSAGKRKQRGNKGKSVERKLNDAMSDEIRWKKTDSSGGILQDELDQKVTDFLSFFSKLTGNSDKPSPIIDSIRGSYSKDLQSVIDKERKKDPDFNQKIPQFSNRKEWDSLILMMFYSSKSYSIMLEFIDGIKKSKKGRHYVASKVIGLMNKFAGREGSMETANLETDVNIRFYDLILSQFTYVMMSILKVDPSFHSNLVLSDDSRIFEKVREITSTVEKMRQMASMV